MTNSSSANDVSAAQVCTNQRSLVDEEFFNNITRMNVYLQMTNFSFCPQVKINHCRGCGLQRSMYLSAKNVYRKSGKHGIVR
jgi:hypothetical protein